jgi:hypothetical protein
VPEWLGLGLPTTPATIGHVVARLLAALAVGGLVAFIYRRTRPAGEASESFTITLVLLSVLIAMVTQVIGDNVARAFSLVGALSIVRFRTVVRDTQDTAYVIFSVAVGMAVGADNLVVALSGIVIVGIAAMLMKGRTPPLTPLALDEYPFELKLRLPLGADAEQLIGGTLERLGVRRRLVTIGTGRQGLALEVGYRAAVKETSASELVSTLNRIEGVQSVTLQRADAGDS